MPRGIPNSGASTKAKNNPVLASGVISTEDMPTGQTVRTGNPDAATAQERIGEPQLVQVADSLDMDPEKEAMMRFMEEPVTIRPTRTTDPKELVFELTINGRPELFRVGQEKTVKRYYVDHMARMKVTSYTQQETVNAEGEKTFINIPHTVLKYDFEMVRDANPLGESWLRATKAMGG